MTITATSTPTLIAASAEPSAPDTGEIAQREPGRDRRTAAEARSQRQEERREQDESGDQENNAEHQLWSPATSIPVVRATGVTK